MMNIRRVLSVSVFLFLTALCQAQTLPKYEVLPLTSYESTAVPMGGRWWALKIDRSLKKFSKCIAVVDRGQPALVLTMTCAPEPNLSAYPDDVTRSSFTAPLHVQNVPSSSTVIVWSINNDTGAVVACAVATMQILPPCASSN